MKEQRGGKCANMVYTGKSIVPGVFERINRPVDCQSGGKRKKSLKKTRKIPKNSIKRKQTKNKKRRSKLTKKQKEQHVELIIDKLCKSMKKCTPKYRELLKKIVIKNM